ncbi:hypothetical protein M9H77_31980 [Catharanthus roseus]|uniref:Uncharacterized protein n=1 Tax=Catharanthus roseus TaxID=4058 RepID=A0ACC0A1P2_CATRO|nr:hypothetical protein M9H77_31980 [Catharanthus roseus]
MNFYICKRLISHTIKNYSHFQKEEAYFRSFVVFYSSSIKKPTKSNRVVFDLLRKHKFSPEIASKVASELSYLKDVEKCDSMLSFLKGSGFSVAHLERILNSKPRLLNSSIDNTVKPKIKIFQDMGLSSSDIADILSADPWVLYRSAVKGVEPSVMVLRELSGSSSELAKLLKVSGTFLKCNLERTMLPNIELLKSCGISTERIVKLLYSFPRFCLHKPENMKKFVEKADSLGCNRNSRMYLHSLRTLASMSEKSWELKLEVFRNLGFSEEEILVMFQKKPQIFAISNRKIKKAVQILLETGKYDISYVFNHAEVLICSVEKRLGPRLRVLDILESRSLLKKRPRLSTIYKYTNEIFFKKYVSPYLDEVSELTSEGAWTKEIHNLT